jgi:Family of unknown function (DUF6064)
MHGRRGIAKGAAVAVRRRRLPSPTAYTPRTRGRGHPAHQFLAMFARANTTAWPMQIVWYLAAVAMTGLALWPVRWSSQLTCALAAGYFAWIGIGFFAWLMPGMSLSAVWAAAFTLQAVLHAGGRGHLSIESCVAYVLYAGFARRSDKRVGLAAAVVTGETLVFAGTGFRWPLTRLAERYGAEHGSVTDIYLPKWFAHNTPAITRRCSWSCGASPAS